MMKRGSPKGEWDSPLKLKKGNRMGGMGDGKNTREREREKSGESPTGEKGVKEERGC